MVDLTGFSCEKQIAKGGMAEVYRGTQLSLHRPVAIKFLSESFLDHPEARQLFEQESLIIAQLSHPNIVNVIDKGIMDDRPYFVMEYLSGSDLLDYIERYQPDFLSLIDIILNICKGVAYAHHNGIVHRDLKPSNIYIDEHGMPKILDFGIALLFSGNNKPQSESVVGSRNYMSPEQLTHPGQVDHLSDIYALGVIMYRVFTGKLPNQGKLTAPAKINPHVPAECSKLILLCLSPDKALRPQSMDIIRDTLLKVVQGRHLSPTKTEKINQLLSNDQNTKQTNNKTRLLDVINEKKFSSLYLFQDTVNSQLIILKKISGHHSGLKEAQALTTLHHPNLGRVIGVSEKSHQTIIVSEYLSGGSLGNHLHRPASAALFLELAVPVCKGLGFAHNKLIIHNNLHPDNILLDDQGSPKIVDFGIYTPDHDHSELHRSYRCYSNEKPGPQSDIFMLGALFHHLLLGKPPQIVKQRWRRSRSLDSLAPNLRSLLIKMLTDDTERRYQNCDDVLAALASVKALHNSQMQTKAPLDEGAVVQNYTPKKTRKKPGKLAKRIKLIVFVATLITLIELYLFFPEKVTFYFQSFVTMLSDLITTMRHMRG